MADSYCSKINQSSPNKKDAKSGDQLLSLPDVSGSTYTPHGDDSISGSLDYYLSCKEMVNEGVACDIHVCVNMNMEKSCLLSHSCNTTCGMMTQLVT